MRWFHLSVAGETLGPCTIEEVREHIESGRADGATPYWEEGMEDWAPLVELIPELAGPAAAPAGVPVARPVPAVPLAGQVPAEPRLTVMTAQAQFALRAKRDRVGWRAAVIGWLLVFAALVAALFHGSPLAIGIGLLAVVAAALAAFVVLANRKVLGGLVLLASAAVLPYLVFAYAKRNNMTPFGMTFGREAATVDRQSFDFLDATFTRGNGEMTLAGRLHNRSGRPLGNLQVTVEWLDGGGVLLGKSSTVVNGGAEVQPDQAVPFTVTAKDDPAVNKYKSYVEFAAAK